MFKKKQATQNNQPSFNLSNMNQKLRTPLNSSKLSKSNLVNNSRNKNSASSNPSHYSNSIHNEFYQEQQQDYVAQESYASQEQSTLSYHEYKDILNNLFENGQTDQEWARMPEILKLIIKAMHFSMNSIETKIVQNRQIINEQGIQIKDNFLQIDGIKKNLKRINTKLHTLNQTELDQQLHTPELKHPQPSQNKQNISIYSKGLDMIMIEEVKTITDAIIAQKSTDIIDEVTKFNLNLQQKIMNEIQELKDKINEDFNTKNQAQKNQDKIYQDIGKVDNALKERIGMVEQQIEHLSRQIMSEKEAMCNFAHYVQKNFCSKNSIDQILKSTNTSQHKTKITSDSNPSNNPLLNRNKIEQIVKSQIDNCHSLLKKKEFQQFRDKVNSKIAYYPTVQEVEKIVEKASKNQLSKIQRMNKMYAKHDLIKEDQPTLELKKSNYHSSKLEEKPLQKSPNLKKKSSQNQTKKTSQSRLESSQVSKMSKENTRTVSNYEQTEQNSPISEQKISRSKTFKESNTKTAVSEVENDKSNLTSKFETKIKLLLTAVKNECAKKIEQEIANFEKKVFKRLEAAEQEFCLVVEENWKTMTQKNLKVQKAEKQNMQHLLNIFSLLNVIARYTTIVNCKANECIKWQKQVFNAQGKAFYLNSQRTHLQINSPGVYEVHIVLYTLYDPTIAFNVELNSEEIYSSVESSRKDIKMLAEKEGNELGEMKKNKKNSNIVKKGTHPSRGVEFFETLLIPAKSHLVVRMVEEMSGQGLIEVRKL